MGRFFRCALAVLLLLTISVGALAETVCQLGDTGDKVRAVQTRLYTLEYVDEAPVSPYKFTSVTKAAVRKFQLANSLDTTGVVDDKTYSRLTLSSAISYPAYLDAMHTLGGSGEEVKQTKTRLKSLGYLTGTVTASYDENTRSAVVFFQQANNLAPTGNADKETRAAIFSSDAVTASEYRKANNLVALKKGDTGEQVKTLQRQLKALGYYDGAINGAYDAATVTAVKLFQTANGLPVKGSANETTRALLNSGAAKSYAQYEQEQSLIEVKKGDKGLSVKLLQKRLAQLAFYAGAEDGKFTAKVQKAVMRFQVANGVNASGAKHGVATQATREVMNSQDAINRYDSEGLLPGDDLPAVKEMTQALKKLGYIEGVTSKYTSAVVTAVKLFQKANSLTVTGNATPATLKVIYSDSALSYDEFKNGSGNDRIEKLIDFSMKFLGRPYRSPCSAPTSFDCSGFTKYCLKKALNISTSGEVATQGNSLKKKYGAITEMNSLKRGDILFFDTQPGVKPIGHSAIYLGKSNGSPRFIHASSAKEQVVVSVFSDWYKERFLFGVRVVK